MKNVCGIYCFTNIKNGKKYIGQSINIQDRYSQHKSRYQIKNDSGYKCAFHLALRKYGFDSFSFKILEECDEKLLDEKERYWIDKCNSLTPNGYNIELGGRRNKSGRKFTANDYICPVCGNKKTKEAERCFKCADLYKREHGIGAASKPPLLRDDMINIDFIDEILSSSMEAVAKKYGYQTGNSVKKRLIANGIPCKKDKLIEYYKQQTGEEHPAVLMKRKREEAKRIEREKQKPKKVGKFDDNGKLLEIFESTRDAHRAGYNSGSISDCCNGKQRHHKGFIWKYL